MDENDVIVIVDDEDGTVTAEPEPDESGSPGQDVPVPPEVVIVSVVVLYYGTDDVDDVPTISGTEWLSTKPSNKAYIWITSKKTYSDDSVAYSTPILDESSRDEPVDPVIPPEEDGGYVPPEEMDDSDVTDSEAWLTDVDPLPEEIDPPEALTDEETQDLLNQTGIFNLLTNNGEARGLFLQNDSQGVPQLYVNMTFARTGVLQVGGSNNSLGVIQVLDAENNVIGQWDRTGITLDGGTIRSADNSSWWNLNTGLLNLNGYITQNTVEYALGNSPTTPPTTGWSTTAPTWTPGEFLWSRTTLKQTGSADRVTTTCLTHQAGPIYRYWNEYSISGNIWTFTAHLTRSGVDVTDDVSVTNFKWYKKTQAGQVLLGTGKTIAIDVSIFNYGGSVVGVYTDEG